MTPRPYLSYTQKRLWKQNPDRYVEEYLYGKAKVDTAEMKFGKVVADALEHDEETGDIEIDAVIELIPKFELMDQPTNVLLKLDKKNHVPLHGRMDTRKADYSAFKEYKTGRYSPDGKPAWTQAKVDSDKQITFYAVMAYLESKKICEDIELVWAVTDVSPHDGQTIIFTGEIKRFRTRRSMHQVVEEMADMSNVWKQINERCAKELDLINTL